MPPITSERQRAFAVLPIRCHMNHALHDGRLAQLARAQPRAAGLEECLDARAAQVHALLGVFDGCGGTVREQRGGLVGHALADVVSHSCCRRSMACDPR